MMVLDTNVISELMEPEPDQGVVGWVDSLDTADIHTTSITVFELERGIRKRDPGRRRDHLELRFPELVDTWLRGRVLPLDRVAASLAAAIQDGRRRRGYVVEERDTFIAGIVIANGATLATRNGRHFADLAIDVVNPWGPDGPGPDA